MAEQGEVGASRRLISWKEIAVYLQRDVRTVRRWEAREGLPVHRHTHNHKATVYAFPGELDEWRKSREPEGSAPPPPARLRPLAWVATALVTFSAVGALVWIKSHHPQESPPAFASRLFAHVAQEGGQLRWIATRPHPLTLAKNSKTGEIYVLTEDGTVQAVLDDGHPVVRDVWKGRARSIAIREDGSLLAIGTDDYQVLLVTPAGHVTNTFHLQNPPSGMVFSADGEDLYVAALFSGLKRIHIPSRQLLPFSAMPGRCPVALAFSPDGRRLYANYQCGSPKGGHNEIDVLDAHTGESLGLITGIANVGNPMAVSPNGSEIWANAGDACINPHYDHVGCPYFPAGVVNVVRTGDKGLVHSFAFPVNEPVGTITFFPDGSRALFGGTPLRVVDTASLEIVESYPLRVPGDSVFSSAGDRLYIPAYDKNAIAVVDLPADCRPAPSGLAGWWAGDGNGSDLRAANDAEVGPGVSLVPGVTGQAFAFNGTGDLRISRFSSGFTSDARLFTLAAWIRPARTGSASPIFEISHRDTVKPLWRLELQADGSLVFCEWDQEKICTAPAGGGPMILQAGTWYHVTAVHGSRGLALQVNGRDAGAAATTERLAADWFNITFGGDRTRKSFFEGTLDELQFYNRPLSAMEVRNLYESRHSGICYR